MKLIQYFIIVLLGIIVLAFPKATYSACQAPDSFGICNLISKCSGGTGAIVGCCDTASECPSMVSAANSGQVKQGQKFGKPVQPTQKKVCEFAGAKSAECDACMGQSTVGAWTAFGCVSLDSGDIVTNLIKFGVGIAGGVAMILIILGGFQIMTSSGNPEKLNAGKELLSSAIAGLLMIVFSVFILKLIGVDLLGIPGWG